MFNENERIHFQSFDGCSTRNLVEITSKPTKTGAGYYTTKQTEMHLLMLGTKLVLFWADTSEKLEKLVDTKIKMIDGISSFHHLFLPFLLSKFIWLQLL